MFECVFGVRPHGVRCGCVESSDRFDRRVGLLDERGTGGLRTRHEIVLWARKRIGHRRTITPPLYRRFLSMIIGFLSGNLAGF